jgi:co-chaperonin GroES (HSP10)
MNNAYQPTSKLDQVSWITDPNVPDPENIPVPLGWCLLVRPYPVEYDKQKSSLILHSNEIDYMNYVTNIGRIVAVGPCCWNRAEHRMKDGTQKDWAKVGDFISYPKNVGSKRKFKGVSYVLLVDDEIVERLPDPQVFDNGSYKVNIPDTHLDIYNTYRNEPTTKAKQKED